tara:strand:+ start:560 stop:1117 length:558 start_codon:yes stop_codon:yes gene_type:complete
MKTAILLIPGFGLHPADYSIFIDHTDVHVVTLDIWPQHAEDFKEIGMPGSTTFNSWFERTLQKLDNVLTENPSIGTIFVHSAGYLFGKRLASRFGTRVVAFGVTPEVSTKTVFINGEYDSVASTHGSQHILPCGHFGCVSEEAAGRCHALLEALKQMCKEKEVYIDCRVEVAQLVKRYVTSINGE